MKFFLCLLLALCLSGASYAQETPPSLEEYKDVLPGLLALDKNVTPSQPAEETPVVQTKPDEPAPPPAKTIEEILAAYHQGQFDSIANDVLILANKADPQAEELLGLMYKSGQGLPKDIDKAYLWLTKAAEARRPLAQHHLGVMHFRGEGVAVDHAKALMWLELASLYYPEGAEKKRATDDRNNLAAQTTKHNEELSKELVREWLDKKGERRKFGY